MEESNASTRLDTPEPETADQIVISEAEEAGMPISGAPDSALETLSSAEDVHTSLIALDLPITEMFSAADSAYNPDCVPSSQEGGASHTDAAALISQASDEFLRPSNAFSYPERPNPEAVLASFTSNDSPEPGRLSSAPQAEGVIAYQPHPGITGAVYSGIPVWECVVNGIQVMRRCNDSYLNCTQLLKVAGIDKGRRTKILEREIFKTHHEKVQGGYGKYQGTWIPFEEGRLFARRHGVEDAILPLLDLDPAEAEIPSKVLSKEVAQAKRFASGSATNGASLKPPTGIPVPKRPEPASKPNTTPKKRIHRTPTNPPLIYAKPMIRPILAPDGRRKLLLAACMDSEFADVPFDFTELPPSELDLPLDNEGHTAAHWAAAFGRAATLQLLLKHGANPSSKAHDGITPLMRAVRFSHCHNRGTFGAVLGCLAPTLACVDALGRTVVHHLVITADHAEFREASLAYLHALADLFSSSKPTSPHFPVSTLHQLLDLQDNEGDTASHLAARLNSPSLLSALASYGANFQLPNSFGLTTNHCLEELPSIPEAIPSFSPPVHSSFRAPASYASEAAELVSHLVSKIETSYQTQLQQYQREVETLRHKLTHASRCITLLQHQLHNAGLQPPNVAAYPLPGLTQGTATQASLASDLSPASLSVSPKSPAAPANDPASHPNLGPSHRPSSPVSSLRNSPA
ncbi:transcriptional regulator swi6 [Massospora cicadina]|nr:transcriptional regulator swi6 [Massospora cicadina]